jgi:hypothetical protein
MIVYLASPNTQQQAQSLEDMPVLLSYAIHKGCEWIHKGYHQSFKRILIDSGAFSAFNSGKNLSVECYMDWAYQWMNTADAIAGLDDIEGNWRKSVANYLKFPQGFPTFHETDPWELLDELVHLCKERMLWLGIGLLPPRKGKEYFVRKVCDSIPEDIHVHGWACREYTYIRRIDSVDSTNWWRDAMKLRTIKDLNHLNYGECLDIVVKRYKRWSRFIKGKSE